MQKQSSDQSRALVRQHIVVDRLREMIMAGELEGGDRLLEIHLSEQLEVSRTPVREALIVLAEEGLVEYRPNRGYVVRTFTLSYIMDAYVVREALEGVACRLAAERGISDEMFDRMSSLLKKSDLILATKGLSGDVRIPLREVNDKFHRFIVEASGNQALAQALTTATTIPYASSRITHWYKEGDIEGLFELRTLHAQHHTILNAVRAREGYRAETLMRNHIASAAEGIRKRLVSEKEDDHSDSRTRLRLVHTASKAR